MTMHGTAYFESLFAAEKYYSKEIAAIKIKDGLIFIGKPSLKNGQKLLIHKTERRYIIETH